MDLQKIASDVTGYLRVFEPVIALDSPGAAKAIDVASRIAQAAIAGEAAAVAVVAQVKAGTDVSPAQVQQADIDFDAAMLDLGSALDDADKMG